MNKLIPSFETTLLVAVFLFFTLPLQRAFIATMLLPVFVCVWCYDIVMMVRDPGQRLVRASRIAIWILAFGALAGLNLSWYCESRSYAERIAAALLAQKARAGAYPDTLEQIGIDSHESAARKWRLVYKLEKGAPSLLYGATFEAYNVYDYDFATHRWRYVTN